MRKARILLFLGIWVTILPYLGFPYSWKETLFTLSGLGLIYVSYLLYNDYKIKENSKKKVFDNFVENGNFEESKIEVTVEEPDQI